MNGKENLRILIDSVIGINVKYEPVEQAHRFNIFLILRQGHEEVNLHSRFIAELMDPQGRHGHGSEFLELFIQLIDYQDVLELSGKDICASAKVKVEKPFYIDENTRGRIDIFIQTPSRIIVIENKIKASDQPAQLDRYYEYAQSFGLRLKPLVCYLTLQGDTPGGGTWSDRLGYSALKELSYKEDIRTWLNLCVERSALEPALRETIGQYRSLIDKLTGDTMSADHKKEILAAITRSEGSFRAAKAINEAWDVARTDGILKYWEKIEEKFRQIVGDSDGTRIQSVQKYSRRTIFNRIRKRKIAPYRNHGVMVTIGQYPPPDNIHICLYIEANENKGMVFGITMVDFAAEDTPNRQINDLYRFNDLKEAIIPESFKISHKWWLGRSKLQDVPNIAEPENDEVMELMLQEKREEAVITTMEQVVKGLLSYVTDHLSFEEPVIRWFLNSEYLERF